MYNNHYLDTFFKSERQDVDEDSVIEEDLNSASRQIIILIGAFWPIFINTLNGVINVDKKLIDSARVLNVNEYSMLFRIILPRALPSIISGATIGLVMRFILLTAAEMIGATSGLGWYVNYFVDYGLLGIEVYYPVHGLQDVAKYLDIANKYNLLITGGTDWHGSYLNGKLYWVNME